ncbi:DUF916 and DUF3324 domain-containing protein [Enterococcus faecalis]|uniref:DUF916 and DUF3324 domain-containing protein n=1 Tax=Enterococcus faecalis TaxID=1351 RepID=UPI001F5AE19D|nr:DUF916 and DUF3324 domain-containing protein [Enterococcus faecalis]
MGRILTKLLFFLSITLLILVGANDSFAQEKNNQFSITPLNPENDQPQSSYYDLKMAPQEKKELKLRISNKNEAPLKVKIELNNGTTNDNGITSYLNKDSRDSTLKIAFEDIANIENSIVVVPSNGTKDVLVTLTLPDQKFLGVILGGIRFTQLDSENSKRSSASVIAKSAYTVGVVVRENEKEIEPNIKLNDVIATQRNYRNYITANLQNTEPRILKTLKVKAEVYKADKNKLMYKSEQDGMRMAPNSNFNFGVNLNDQKLMFGKYLLKLVVEADGKKFLFEKSFTISKKEAFRLNKNAVLVKSDNLNIYFFISVFFILFVVSLFMVCLLYKKKLLKGGK